MRHKRIVLFLGRIHPKKGCDLTIRAFAEVSSNRNDWHLVMAGPDQVGLKPSLLKLAKELGIADRITWTGLIENKIKWGALLSSEVLFLPSHQENFGIVVAEALACKLPVLISNKVNIWREIENDQAGFVGADSLSGAIEILRKWSELPINDQIRMRASARRCFEHRFEITRASDNFLAALSDIAKQDEEMCKANVA